MSLKTKFDVVKFLANLIFKKEIQKQKGIMKILPGAKVDAEEKAKFALKKLQERANINTDNLTKSDLEFIAQGIANPFKYGEKTVVKSADILPFRFKRSFAEELADASKKGDFTRMSGIMKLDPKFKEVMKAFKKSKADKEAYEKMVGPKKLIPDRDVIPYQSPEIAKLKGAERMNYLITSPEQTAKLLKKGVTSDDIIYAQDRYGMTAKDMVDAVDAGFKFPFADGGVAGLLGERVGLRRGGNPHSRGRGRQSSGMSLSGATNIGGTTSGTTKGGPHGGGRRTPPPKKKTTTGGGSGTTTPKTNIRGFPITRTVKPGFLDRFNKHRIATQIMKNKMVSGAPTYTHELGGLNFKENFPNMSDTTAAILGYGYQGITEATRALAKPTSTNIFGLSKNLFDAGKKAISEGSKNLEGFKGQGIPATSLNQYNEFMGNLNLADGGPARQNFAMGRRAFMKLLGGVGAGIGALKTGAFKLLGKEAAPVAKEVVKDVATTSSPPPYFLNLVNKIKTLGDNTLATKDKVIAKKYKDYVMEEDFAGNIEIVKKGGDDVFPEDVYMSYKVDEVPLKGKKGSAKVEDYEEFTARPDRDGKMKDVEQGVPDEVVQEGTMFEDNITDFGKASGGVARLLGE